MGLRRIGSTQRKRQRAKVKSANGRKKARERSSRDRRMVEILKGGPMPTALPWVTSWLTDQLGKPPRAITQADVDQVVARHAG